MSYDPPMALVVFLRGVNVGGHRTFRPSLLAKELREFDVVNIGAAGTFVVRKPQSQSKFRAALAAKLPFETGIAICEGRELIELAGRNVFGAEAPTDGRVRFVSVMQKRGQPPASIPIMLPADGEWLVRVIACHDDRFLLGEYRRHMKTIGYLGQLDRIFKGTATTRNWNTITAILRILQSEDLEQNGQKKRARRARKQAAR